METKSETKIIWVVVILIGAQLLGIDAPVLLSLLGGVAHHADTTAQIIQAAPEGSTVGNVTLPTLAGVYAWLRSDLKKQREKGGA